MISAFNLKTDSRITFDARTTALWAVCYSYCKQNNRLIELIRSEDQGKFLDFAKRLPVSLNNRSVSCGDWCAKS
ncbi:MAG: hypothetical protein HOK42_03085 [Candidatus Marinimicrobia bacterium]|jgi:hypothetical protein|nr:hypothetical protein [Candidatus Neomarinimicrobiota bacterium]